jgi:hypothetical protein
VRFQYFQLQSLVAEKLEFFSLDQKKLIGMPELLLLDIFVNEEKYYEYLSVTLFAIGKAFFVAI